LYVVPTVPAGKDVVVTVNAGAVTVTVADVPDFEVSCVEVAVKVAVPAATPVTVPDAVIVATAELDEVHVTVVAKLPVPLTVAVHVEVLPTVTELGQLTPTEVMVEGGVVIGPFALPPPPQEVVTNTAAMSNNAKRNRLMAVLFLSTF